MVMLRYRTSSATLTYGIRRGMNDWNLQRLRVVRKTIKYDDISSNIVHEIAYSPISPSDARVLPRQLQAVLQAQTDGLKYSTGSHLSVAIYVDDIEGRIVRYVMSQEKSNSPITTSKIIVDRSNGGRISVVDGWDTGSGPPSVLKHLISIQHLIDQHNKWLL